MKKIPEIPAANEVVSALLAKKYVGDEALLAAVKSDPAKALNMRGATVRVRTVQNTRDLLHVCVPDYEAMQELESSELEQVSGGAGAGTGASSTGGAAAMEAAFRAYLDSGLSISEAAAAYHTDRTAGAGIISAVSQS